LYRILQGLVVHLNRIQCIRQCQNGILLLIGLAFSTGLAGAFHADMAVRINKGRRQHVKFADLAAFF